MVDKKQQIINYLMEDGLSSTSKIASIIKSNFNDTNILLNELESENKIKKTETPTAVYWDVKYKKLPKSKDMIKDIKEKLQ